jgi:simple sugar transport system permease protein
MEFLEFLLSILRVSSPLIMAALAGVWSERSGVINIALEGFMLMGALTGAVVGYSTQNAILGFSMAGFVGVMFAGLYGYFVIARKTDQIVTGTAMNILSFGLAPFVTKLLFDSTGSTPSLDIQVRFHILPYVLVFITVLASDYIFRKTRLGLKIIFAGEHPEALNASGRSVDQVRWQAVLVSGFLACSGGSFLSLFLASSYSPQMTAGRGFMALAAMIFGRWKVLPTLAACLFFGLTESLQTRLQGVHVAGVEIPVQLIQILPYLITIVVLAGFFGKSRAPKSLGQS